MKKFSEIQRTESLTNRFVLVIEAVKLDSATKAQWNFEEDCPPLGKIYAIKVKEHRFYTLYTQNSGCRRLYIARYGKKQSQSNDKKLLTTIQSISTITINTPLK